jgi:hypothetical protein
MDGDKKLKIAFLWYFDKASQVYDNWRDGLRAALEVIEKDHQVTYFLDKTVPDPEDDYDFILFWDDSNSEFFNQLDNYKARKGICLTTDPHNMDNLRKLDVVFVESEPIYNAVRSAGVRTILAFGTDTDFFKPNPKKPKDIPYFYPATFSQWKRQDELADLGSNLWLVGTIQPDGLDIYQKCANRGCRIEVGYFPAVKIRNYFQRAEAVPIPAIHGSERTVLEAMATDILPLVIHPTNRRTYSYIAEYQKSGLTSPREFVLKNYSHHVYAENLLRGIQT